VLARPPAAARRRAAARDRQRRHAARARRGVAVCCVEFDAPMLDVLVDLGYVAERDSADRAAIGRGITAAIRSLLTHSR
jgi:hypothetical protein